MVVLVIVMVSRGGVWLGVIVKAVGGSGRLCIGDDDEEEVLLLVMKVRMI